MQPFYADPILESRSEINQMIDGKYRKMFFGVVEKDHETCGQLMAPYNEWLDEREEGSAGKDVKSVATGMQQYKDQMATMVCNTFNLSYSELIYVFFSRPKVGPIWRILRL
jgi:hypothetical protein